MASISRELLSGLVSGPMITILSDSSASPDFIHDCPLYIGRDEVTLYAVNNDTIDVLLTLDIGGFESKFLLPPRVGLIKVAEKVMLDSGQIINAYTDSSGALTNVTGYVNRISL